MGIKVRHIGIKLKSHLWLHAALATAGAQNLQGTKDMAPQWLGKQSLGKFFWILPPVDLFTHWMPKTF